MAHVQQVNFLKSVKEKFPNKFKNCTVLDIGSLDINGNTRFLFEKPTYVGIDVESMELERHHHMTHLYLKENGQITIKI
jgi:hypothetical protein